MKIHFERSGGFAGLHTELTLDTDDLSSKDADRLRGFLRKAGFFDLASSLRQTKGADYIIYKLTVNDGAREHTFEADEMGVPSELRPLIDFLSAKARTGE